MCCETSNGLKDKFNRATFNEFTDGVTEFAELSKWEYNELKNHVLTVHYDDQKELVLSPRTVYLMASNTRMVNGVWTQTRQSKMNLFT